MNETKNILLKFALVLFLVNLVAASVLTGIYSVTKSRIEKQEKKVRQEALKQVMPDEVGDRIESVEKNGIKYWEVFKGSEDSVRGYIFIAKKNGYAGSIETMVGMKKNGVITGARVLNQSETPGLGAKIVEIASDKTISKAIRDLFSKTKTEEEKIEPYFTEQFKNLKVKDIELNKYGIDAITGATISSKAVVESIREKGSEILKIK